jgi:hypothetical protein
MSEDEKPPTTEAGRALIFPNFLLPSFDIQEPKANPRYWFLCCRTCKLTWHLPKNPTRRTKDAVTILAVHADTHREAGSRRVAEPPPRSACRVCGGMNGPFECVTYAGAPEGGRVGALRLRGRVLRATRRTRTNARGRRARHRRDLGGKASGPLGAGAINQLRMMSALIQPSTKTG